MTERQIVENERNEEDAPLGTFAILIHLGLFFFGIAAWLTGGLADDYKRIEHSGFTLHSWTGMGLACFIFLRLLLGLFGPHGVRFTRWVPLTRERLLRVWEDIAGLLRFRLPERPPHQGIAGLVQTFGLSVFFLMALTGGFMFFSLEPGRKATGLLHSVKELHEVGELLIPFFLSMHGGAVVLHALRGRHLWRKMLFLRETPRTDTYRVQSPGSVQGGSD